MKFWSYLQLVFQITFDAPKTNDVIDITTLTELPSKNVFVSYFSI